MNSSIEKLKRPAIPTPMTGMDKVLEAASLAGILLNVALAALFWGNMSTVVPTSATPGYIWPRIITLSLTTALPVIVYLCMTAISDRAHEFNYPFQVTASNAADTYRASRSIIRQVKALIVWLTLTSELLFLHLPPAMAIVLILVAVAVSCAIIILLLYGLSRFRNIGHDIKTRP